MPLLVVATWLVLGATLATLATLAAGVVGSIVLEALEPRGTMAVTTGMRRFTRCVALWRVSGGGGGGGYEGDDGGGARGMQQNAGTVAF